jgi:hypothetical protein
MTGLGLFIKSALDQVTSGKSSYRLAATDQGFGTSRILLIPPSASYTAT